MVRPAARHARPFPLAVVAALLVAATVLPGGVSAAGRPSSELAAAAPAAVALPAPVPGPGAPGAVSGARIALQRVATGLSQPVLVTHAGDGSNRLFIVEKTGRIRIYRSGAVLPTPFLSITGGVSRGGEQGLLGLAFHPSFRTNRKFYVSYTNTAGTSVIREYRASATNPDVVESGSGRTILAVRQPYANHNGGHIAFGPDGFLYIGLGDGGSAGDPGNRAQSLSTLLGKILRIDVNGKASGRQYRIPSSNPYVGRSGLDEIWSRGLRNPWRFSFDRANGTLWIGDVGQSRYEEVNRAVRSAGGGRGSNYGWRVMEGRHCYRPSSGCSTRYKILPAIEYSHAGGRCSVTGGYAYRGTAIPALVGGYLYGDYCSGEIWVVDSAARSPATGVRLLDTALLLSSFGESQGGELYVCDLNGDVYRIVAG